MGESRQTLQQLLVAQAVQLARLVRQLAAAQRLAQRAAVGQRRGAVQLQGGEQGGDPLGGLARADLGDIAGLPVRRAAGGCQVQVEQGRALAAGVQAAASGQAPGLVVGALPVAELGVAGQLAELLLPVAQHRRIGAVGFQAVEQRRGAACPQMPVELPGKGAEPRVLAVAQAEQGVFQAAQVEAGLLQALGEARGMVGRLAVAVGAGHQQQAWRRACQIERFQRHGAGGQAGAAELRGTAFGDGPRLATLAGIGDRQVVGAGSRDPSGPPAAPGLQADAQPGQHGECGPDGAGRFGPGHQGASTSRVAL